MRIKIFLAVAVVSCFYTVPVHAGSCMSSDDDFRNCIQDPLKFCEKIADETQDDNIKDKVFAGLEEAINCYPVYLYNSPWALYPEGIIDKNLKPRKNPVDIGKAEWVRKYLPPLLEKYPSLKCELAFQLAPYKKDGIFEILTNGGCGDVVKYWGLARLGDDRAVKMFQDYFLKRADLYKKQALAGLLLLGSKKAVPFLEEQLGDPRNKGVKKYIEQIIKNLNK